MRASSESRSATTLARPGPARDQAHLANRVAREYAAHEAATIAIVRRKYAEAAAQNDVQGVGFLAGREQSGAARQ